MYRLITPLLILLLMSCMGCSKDAGHMEMIELLKKVQQQTYSANNPFSSRARLAQIDSLLMLKSTSAQEILLKQRKGKLLLELGQETEAIALLESISDGNDLYQYDILRSLGIAYLRLGERSNCIHHHAAESCILPFRGRGVHQDVTGSRKAIEIYKRMLAVEPNDLESRWLLNLASMTLGLYPEEVPSQYLIPGLEEDTTEQIKPFVDISGRLGLDIKSMSGGAITEDFDNDGFLDLVTSALYLSEQLQYFRNNGDGSFTNLTEKSGLTGITGGLNIMQTDYNNDGYKDIFVLRGGWQKGFGNEPNSLLRNNGDGTFSDVTIASGLLSFHPTQTATWNDFNNDGWLDVFIGNESSEGSEHPSELFLNQGNGTFRNIAAEAGCTINLFVKGVASGDYDNDGWVDLFVSTMNGQHLLLRNEGAGEEGISFGDATQKAGLGKHKGSTFPTWFWDYDNDGWLDIFVCDYSFDKTLAYYAAADKLGFRAGNSHQMLLYRNNQDGTFTNVAQESGLTIPVFAMGANFGDINNDGFLDMYLGTGNPAYQSLIPNKMFLNKGGKHFSDVTTSARLGHLQKGHGIAIADIDHDGDQDIYIQIGGAYEGDAYQNALFMNPGQSDNNWISLELLGVKSNRSAIGSRLVIYITEGNETRKIVRDVNSGGSFGASPLRREIGLGQAKAIDKLEIFWRGSNTVQSFTKLPVNRFLRITEGNSKIETLPYRKIEWNQDVHSHQSHHLSSYK